MYTDLNNDSKIDIGTESRQEAGPGAGEVIARGSTRYDGNILCYDCNGECTGVCICQNS